MLVRLLVAINEGAQRERVGRLLTGLGAHLTLTTGEGLSRRLAAAPADLVIAGLSALADSPRGAIAAMRRLPDAPEVVLLWNRDPYEERARFLAWGCTAVLYTGLGDEALRDVFAELIDRRARRVGPETPDDASRPVRLGEWVAESAAARILVAAARSAAPGDAPLLLVGEAGCGLEPLAHAIHLEGRPGGPFVVARCMAMVDEQIERMLFGARAPETVDQGIALGVVRASRGLVEQAHGGTLFIDELCALPPGAQRTLARLLHGGVLAVGAAPEVATAVDVRVIAGTRTDLVRAVHEGRLDRTLFDRVRGEVIAVPSLRHRREDIPRLAERLLARAAARYGGTAAITQETREELLDYPWPGNDAELGAVMTRAALLARHREAVTPEALPPSVVAAETTVPEPSLPIPERATREPLSISESKRPIEGTPAAVPGAETPRLTPAPIPAPTPTPNATPEPTPEPTLERTLERTPEPTPTPERAGALTRDLLDQPLKAARQAAVERFERAYLTAHLEETHGRVGETAARVGISARALYEKMRALDLKKETFRR